LKDLKRSRWLPAYDEKTIKEAIEEIWSDNRAMVDLIAREDRSLDLPQEVVAGLCLFNDLVDRNRRCLLAYLNFRLERIQDLRFEVGLLVPEDKLGKLHESEKQYLFNFNASLDKYMKNYVPGCKEPLDLTSDQLPPEDRHIQIRVRDEGVGEIVTPDSGIVKLKKGWVHMVKRADVEILIRAGKIEHMGSARADD